MEHSAEDNSALIKRIVEFVTAARERGEKVTAAQDVVYDVDYLLLEANSGVSFEQYFRWATVEEISRIVPALREIGLDDIAQLTQRAIDAAFPKGIPETASDKSDQTDWWTKKQEKQLSKLFTELDDAYSTIINSLAEFARSKRAAPDKPAKRVGRKA